MATKKTKIDRTLKALAGEYYVLAQLAQRNLVGALTLSRTKGIDILVTNPESGSMMRVEVKTTNEGPSLDKVFGTGLFLKWRMNLKHEKIRDSKLVFCFVKLSDPGELPRFFLVSGPEVAAYIKWEHQHYLRCRSTAKTSDFRTFRVREDGTFQIGDSPGRNVEDNWALFS